MPSSRRVARRLVSMLPERLGNKLRRAVRSLQGRLRGGSRGPVTYVVSPHPDDETLRLAGYVTHVREHRAGRLVLVAITDGGASSRARRMGWSPGYEREFRRAEQAAAWSALTGGAGEIIRVGLRDGAVTPEQVRDALKPLNSKRAEFYVAAHEQDRHPDHRAVVAGVRLLDPAHARFSLAPLMIGTGTIHRPKSGSTDAVGIAAAAYEKFGQLSVPREFGALAASDYRSTVTEWSGETAGVRAPVFVLGNQKSGTTAIAALLAECIGETFISDVLHTNKLKLKDLLDGDSSLAALVGSHPESFMATVVKDNDFTFLYRNLAEVFPEARFVFVVRDPRQNIRSVLNRLSLPGDLDSLSAEQYAHLREKLPGWHTILTGSSFGSDAGHYIDVLADRWVRANEVYSSASDRMTLVRYEDFDAAKRPVVERLATELGFNVVYDISPSQDRQFQPLGDRSIAPEAFFGRDNLDRVERRCATLMPSFGYVPGDSAVETPDTGTVGGP